MRMIIDPKNAIISATCETKLYNVDSYYIYNLCELCDYDC